MISSCAVIRMVLITYHYSLITIHRPFIIKNLSTIVSYKIHEVSPYINWIYFFHAWGFQPRFAAIADIHGCDVCRASWLTSFPEEERPKASEAMQLFKEANRMLNLLDEDFEVKTIFKLCQANSQDDNLILDGITFPLLRQQAKKREGGPFLCLSDFVRPLSSGIRRRSIPLPE